MWNKGAEANTDVNLLISSLWFVRETEVSTVTCEKHNAELKTNQLILAIFICAGFSQRKCAR